MTFAFSAPTPSGPMEFVVEPGTSLFFVGANGGGKTRLAVQIETEMGERAHRIAAHRALILNPSVPKISERNARQGLKIGNTNEALTLIHRPGQRWGDKDAVALLNDYDFLVQALFADQANISLKTHKNAHASNLNPPLFTKMEQLVDIWGRILPHRELDITGDDIQVSIKGSEEKYTAYDMSDGERAIFYLIGQTLMAEVDSLIIFDEPELHIHRSIMSRLWDELEAIRTDCSMVFISHDLEFVASRSGQKFVLRDYNPAHGWVIDRVPHDTGFTEEVTTLILGSRKPVLFVEGGGGSLDQAVYRACYPNWTIIPRGSCEEVIHGVMSMRANANLTRVTCAGLVDADAYEASEVAFFQKNGIEVLPVSEIENLFLLPSVIEAIAKAEGHSDVDLRNKVDASLDGLFAHATDKINHNAAVMEYCRRRIDRNLKKIDLSGTSDIETLSAEYKSKTNSIDVSTLAEFASKSINDAINGRNAPELLKWYANKGILRFASWAKDSDAIRFQQWIVRSMRNGSSPALADAIRAVLPSVTAA